MALDQIDPQVLALMLRGGGGGYNPGGGARLQAQVGPGGFVTPGSAGRFALAENLSGRRRALIHSPLQFGIELGQDALAAVLNRQALDQARDDGFARSKSAADAFRVAAGRPEETQGGYTDPATGGDMSIKWQAQPPRPQAAINMLASDPLTADIGADMARKDAERRAAMAQMLFEKGMEADPATGGMRPIRGGPADPAYIHATKSAESGGAAAGAYPYDAAKTANDAQLDVWKKTQEPQVVPEGSVVIGPGAAAPPPGAPRPQLMGAPQPVGGAAALPLGVRNNNPGNIKQSDATWEGAEGGGEGGFVKFRTPEDGAAAMGRSLLAYQDKHGLKTVAGIINRWAPPSENDSAGYAAYVAKRLGVSPDQEIDLRNPATMQRMMGAMIDMENGPGRHPFSGDVVGAGVSRVLDGGAAGGGAGRFVTLYDGNPKGVGANPKSDIGKLYADRDRLPEDDPRRAAYDDAIQKHAGQDVPPADKAAILEADDKASAAKSAMETLRKALQLNGAAYTGFAAETRANLANALPGRQHDAEATLEYNNLISGQAMDQMRATFGANPTEGERGALLELQASLNKPPEVRARIIERMLENLQQRHDSAMARADSLRKGTYFSADGPAPAGPATARPPATATPPQISADAAGQAAYAALPSGTTFIDPTGTVRRKP